MEKKITYLTQYSNMRYDWHCKGIDTDCATDSQIDKIRELQTKAMEQSGLTLNELTLICMCREYKILTKVNVYAHKLRLL